MLVLTGFAAGFVAREIKQRVISVFRSLEERQRVVAAFGQQVSPEIVEELLRQGGRLESKRTYVCVLFMDIRGFTRLVQHRSPEEIVAYQNAVFGAAVETVNRHHGVINQFLGDGFMATFGAPVATGRESANALAAARELLVAVKALSAVGRIPAMSIGIGLHAGEAVSGNIGSEARKQYSVSGDVVILASRIEQLNKVYGSQLLASAEVLHDAGEAPPASASLGPVKVKGRDEPIEIYRLA
jgi:adenylate cyclase